MTKSGDLSKRERDTILRAAQIVEAWVRAQTEQGHTPENSFPVHDAEQAAFQLRELIWETR